MPGLQPKLGEKRETCLRMSKKQEFLIMLEETGIPNGSVLLNLGFLDDE